MSRYAWLTLLTLLCAGCVRDWSPKSAARGPAASDSIQTQRGDAHSDVKPRRRALSGIASLPDLGGLVGYPAQRVVRHDGAYTWHRADFSEEHALRAVAGGTLRVTAPSGEQLAFRYERHVEHPSGDWTWVGRVAKGAPSDEALITFGDRAVFGTISQPGKAPLKLTIRDGVTWLVEADRSRIALIRNAATHPQGPGYLVPPSSSPVPGGQSSGGGGMEASGAQTLDIVTAATTTVDLLLGYTSGFAAALGGQSQALTRLNNMVEAANEAYVNSQVDARIRLVHAVQVSYPDATDNGDTLERLTGYREGTGSIPVDPAFNALRAAREQYGADLVSLVRKFNDPENNGCGIAWLIGGGRRAISAADAGFGYSVVSDGQDAGADGKTYFCREETLAHETAHNMGSQHDRATATVNGSLNYGVYDYSFGYKTGAGAGSFYTIMAYGESNQTGYRVFSNPGTNFCGSLACGVANQSDNARSLRQTLPIVSGFRAGATSGRVLDLYAVKKNGVSNTEVRTLSGPNNFQVYSGSTASLLGRTGMDESWNFEFADFNRDGVSDMYSIKKVGASGRTEVHILNGANGFKSYLLNVATILGQTGTNNAWEFKLADFNRDSRPDLYAIKKQGVGSRVEIRVLNGANNFQTYLFSGQTALGPIAIDYSWNFDLGDSNGDGNPDLYAFKKVSGTGKTEVQVLNAVGGFRNYLLSRPAILGQTGSNNAWDFKVGDFNRDGVLDVYAIKKVGANGRTEVHVLNGANQFQSYLLNIATVLGATGTDASWKFGLGPSRS